MKGLPGWLFAAGSALPLRLRTAVLRRATSLGPAASRCCAGLLESRAGGAPEKDLSGRRKRAVSLRRLLADGKALARRLGAGTAAHA